MSDGAITCGFSFIGKVLCCRLIQFYAKNGKHQKAERNWLSSDAANIIFSCLLNIAKTSQLRKIDGQLQILHKTGRQTPFTEVAEIRYNVKTMLNCNICAR